MDDRQAIPRIIRTLKALPTLHTLSIANSPWQSMPSLSPATRFVIPSVSTLTLGASLAPILQYFPNIRILNSAVPFDGRHLLHGAATFCKQLDAFNNLGLAADMGQYLRDTTPNIHKLSVEGRLYDPSFSIDLVEQSIRSMAGMVNLSALTIRYSLDVTHIESWTVEPEDHELRLCYLKHYHGTQKILTHETAFTLMNGKWSTDVHYFPTGLRDCDLVNLTG
ncbi:hypothetical protein B0H16DRAFT_1844861 [Mycena metata]|uniref:Uncharacterized protein n=1 Tax=Mycena metata TaxID=1033252 RepID=A0AAD7ISR3_9AGAR|nr:hypothetical protein B0H16DRAFT_1844861 [Mycena metata]